MKVNFTNEKPIVRKQKYVSLVSDFLSSDTKYAKITVETDEKVHTIWTGITNVIKRKGYKNLHVWENKTDGFVCIEKL